uniref:Zinc finger BED domain-containing protein RICESLEEPER 2-like n=1 Tax=Hordeum vulgare subsp. vulgare TaxID=112509 RepID=A0A8I6XXJ4_HORVV
MLEPEQNGGNVILGSQLSLTMSSEDTEKGNNVKEEVEGEEKKHQSQKEAKKRKEMEPRSNKLLTVEASTDEEDSTKCALTAWAFEPEKMRYALAKMIILDGLPFAFSEKPGFRKLLSEACPWFNVPSRRTTIRDCVSIYYREKQKLKKFFKENCERVSLTTNTWTSMQQQSYMCVTAHFLDTDWKLHKRIIGFFLISCRKGEEIGKDVKRCLVYWGLEKVFSITVDDASANDGTISYLKMVMNNAKTSIAKGQYIHMRCAAHAINLIVSDCLRELDIPVKRVRAAVRFIRNCPSRITQFKRCADLEKVDSKAFLPLDVCTKWNSTYLMLKTAATYEKVFDRYGDDDPYFATELNSEEEPGVPEALDWEYARKISEFLEPFYNLTVRVSAYNHCTSHIFFHEIADVYILLTEWCESTDALRKEMAERMIAKYNKYWGDHESFNILIFVAVALDPRYKLSDYTRFATYEMFGEIKGEEVWKKMRETLNDLFKEYVKMYASSEKKEMESDVVQGMSLMRSLIAKRMRMNNTAVDLTKSELEKYLAEETEADTTKFDILEWWKVKSSRFPVLSRLARDVLAVPISAVATEFAFSTGGRILDEFRSSLTPFILQALICAQDWMLGSAPVNDEEDTEQLTEVVEELLEEMVGLNLSETSSSYDNSISDDA